jgi:hypothetical protein
MDEPCRGVVRGPDRPERRRPGRREGDDAADGRRGRPRGSRGDARPDGRPRGPDVHDRAGLQGRDVPLPERRPGRPRHEPLRLERRRPPRAGGAGGPRPVGGKRPVPLSGPFVQHLPRQRRNDPVADVRRREPRLFGPRRQRDSVPRRARGLGPAGPLRPGLRAVDRSARRPPPPPPQRVRREGRGPHRAQLAAVGHARRAGGGSAGFLRRARCRLSRRGFGPGCRRHRLLLLGPRRRPDGDGRLRDAVLPAGRQLHRPRDRHRRHRRDRDGPGRRHDPGAAAGPRPFQAPAGRPRRARSRRRALHDRADTRLAGLGGDARAPPLHRVRGLGLRLGQRRPRGEGDPDHSGRHRVPQVAGAPDSRRRNEPGWHPSGPPRRGDEFFGLLHRRPNFDPG